MALKADRLKQLRHEKKWSLDDLSAHSGLHRTQLYRYETGENDPTGSLLTKLAQTFNVSVDYLLGLTDQRNGSYGDTLTPEEGAIVDAFRRADFPTILEMCVDLARRSGR